MASQQSFDISTGADLQEVDNAVNQARKELSQRFDFKNTGTSLAWSGEEVVIVSKTDQRALAALAGGDGKARRADADAVRAATGFPIGGVPPFGHPSVLATYLDEELLTFDTVWAAAGTPRHNFGIRPDDLLAVTGATVARLARR